MQPLYMFFTLRSPILSFRRTMTCFFVMAYTSGPRYFMNIYKIHGDKNLFSVMKLKARYMRETNCDCLTAIIAVIIFSAKSVRTTAVGKITTIIYIKAPTLISQSLTYFTKRNLTQHIHFLLA